MEPIVSKLIPNGSEWIHQVKWDGIRGITYINGSDYRVVTKKGYERTEFYPELQLLGSLFKGKEAVFDGELVVFDQEFRPDFQKILHRERGKANKTYYQKKYPIHYILFDILRIDGKDLRTLPLEERYDYLNTSVEKHSIITITDNFKDGHQLFKLMQEKNFEGIVSKKKESTYTVGKHHKNWYKIKIKKKLLTVIGGIKYKDKFPSSLLVGIFREDKLYYVSSVSIGLKEEDKRILHSYKDKILEKESPFENLKKSASTVWMKPLVTCWVGFMEWTDDGGLRHPKLLGFSVDKGTEANGREFTDDDQN
jgi:bifunctional non-homologous end joining protein LigD